MSIRRLSRAVLSMGLLAATGLAAARLAGLVVAAPAAITFTVNSTLDQIDDNLADSVCHTASGACTLRAAVMQADVASGLGVTIQLPSGVYSLTLFAGGADLADNGDLNLTSPLSGQPFINLVGAGAASTIIDAGQIDRALTVSNTRTATISGLTLRDGFVSDGHEGGGLYNAGTLTVTDSTITGNQSGTGAGGGIINWGTLWVIQSTIAGNQAATFGGGLYNGFSVIVDRSTLYGNSADFGGGLYNAHPKNMIVVNSTLSENKAVNDGGGIYNAGPANVYNSTIVFNGADSQRNSAGTAGGVFSNGAGTFNLRNTLLAGNNVANTLIYDDCTGTLNTYGNNLLGEPTPCTVMQNGAGMTGTLNSLDLIGPLGNYGGPTLTHAPLAGSNAIDDGSVCVDYNSVPLATDQRGVARVVGAACDIGAFEFLPPAAFLPLLRR